MYAGVDIGGTTIGIGITDRSGELLFYSKIDTDKSYSPELIELDICRVLELGLSSAGNGRLESIGIGVPGIVSEDRRCVLVCANLKWKEIDFGSRLAEKFSAKTALYNDATAAAFGEYVLGEMKNYANGVMITLGTGLGGGIIRDGEIYEGAHGVASEFGHMTVGDNFYTCGCGRIGCLETFASGTALIEYVNKLLSERGDDFRVSSAKEAFELSESGDKVGIRAVERFVKYLSIGIVNIISTIDPEVVVLGGGLSLSGDIYLEKLREYVSEWRYFKEIPPPKIEISSLNESSGVLGAALLGKKAISL